MGDRVPVHAYRLAGPRRQAMAATVLRGLSRFADTRGIPADAKFLLDYDVIEAFCVAGLRGRASCTQGTYRSVLYRLAVPVHGRPGLRGTPFAGAAAPAPYSDGERAELAAIAAAQPDPAKRGSALAMVVFGIGAGLRPGELVALRGSDVHRRGRRVMAEVSGPAARVVPVASGYAGRAAELARGAGSGFVFRPGPADRGYKNFVTSFAAGLVLRGAEDADVGGVRDADVVTRKGPAAGWLRGFGGDGAGGCGRGAGQVSVTSVMAARAACSSTMALPAA